LRFGVVIRPHVVIPAQAGIQFFLFSAILCWQKIKNWIPACAAMTDSGERG